LNADRGTAQHRFGGREIPPAAQSDAEVDRMGSAAGVLLGRAAQRLDRLLEPLEVH
jgi:hypothetical protein